MKNKIYHILFFVYIIFLAVLLQKGVKLEHEWKIIMNDFSKGSGYSMYGLPTAYMPPFYSYFLLICSKVFALSIWLKMSCVIQAVIYYFSLWYLFKIVLKDALEKWGVVLVFCSILFFPPIVVGAVSISSFSLSVSIICLFFSLLYKIYSDKNPSKKDLIYLILVSVAGLYIRYEFLFLMILSGLIYLYFRKIGLISFIKIICFIFLVYLPWSVRNYMDIGKFTYSTSLSYNFAKGYNEHYNIYSSYNFPYSSKDKKELPINVLYRDFGSEKEIDDYLASLNRDFISQHPLLFVKLTAEKFLINLFQYFPDYNGLSKHGFYFLYSLFFLVFQTLLALALKKLKDAKKYDLFLSTLAVYLFVILFYIIAPMPRYFLLFYPLFSVVITKVFLGNDNMLLRYKTKKTIS